MKKSILVVVDKWGWAFDRISHQIKLGYGAKYDITIRTSHECIVDQKPLHYDLIICLWWGALKDIQKKFKAKKSVLALYDHFTWTNNRFMRSQNFNMADGIVLCNHRLVDQIQEYLPENKPTWVCEDGVDLGYFKPVPFPNRFTVCWAGNSKAAASNLKGYSFVEEACRKLDIPLLTADAYKKMLSFDTMLQFYSGATIGCFPSESEGTPNPLLELLAMGRMVAITDVGLSDRVVRENGTGTIIPERSVDAVADAIDRLRQMDPEKQVARCVKAAKSYSWDRKIKSWQPVFDALLEK